MFYIGQQVVCVDDRETDARGSRELTRGSIYTVSWIGHWDWIAITNGFPDCGLGVSVAEIKRRLAVPFWHGRFRPLKKTDISIFTSMLAPVRGKELVQ